MILNAAEDWSLQGHRIHLFGFYHTGREAGEVSAYIPILAASQELGLAYLSYVLKSYQVGWGESKPEWFEKGLSYVNLLPWEQEHAAQKAEYAARPKCWVPRRWARMALGQLNEVLPGLEPDLPVMFSFDGQVLVANVVGRSFPMPAEGSAWDRRYQIAAKCLIELPKRFREDPVEFSVGREVLYIDRRRYGGLAAVPSETADPSMD